MRKQLFMNHEKGFALPMVLFFISIFIIALSTSIELYKNEMNITKNIVEEYKTKTLYIRAKNKLLSNPNLKEDSTLEFSFPDGEVTIKYVENFDKYAHLEYTIRTAEQYRIRFSEYMTNEIFESIAETEP